jgi:hypothetical protein
MLKIIIKKGSAMSIEISDQSDTRQIPVTHIEITPLTPVFESVKSLLAKTAVREMFDKTTVQDDALDILQQLLVAEDTYKGLLETSS